MEYPASDGKLYASVCLFKSSASITVYYDRHNNYNVSLKNNFKKQKTKIRFQITSLYLPLLTSGMLDQLHNNSFFSIHLNDFIIKIKWQKPSPHIKV